MGRKRRKERKERTKETRIMQRNHMQEISSLVCIHEAPQNLPKCFVTIGTEYSSLHRHRIDLEASLIKPSTFPATEHVFPICHPGQVEEIWKCKFSL